MILDIRTLPTGHSSIGQATDLGLLKEELPPLNGKIVCLAELNRNGPELYIHIRFNGAYTLECSRCLEPFLCPVEGDLRLIAREHQGKHGQATDDESVDYYYDSRHPEIDCSPSIYEEVMTALPLKPLCKEECKGLPGMEDILNEAAYVSKSGPEIDPRWDALKKLKTRGR